MTINSTVAFASGAIIALVLGSGTAYAANGGNFKLGQSNSESHESSLNNSSGTALVLRSKAGLPPMRVNHTTKVPNLNADLVDGVNSSQIARVVQVGTVTAAGFVDDNGTTGDTSDDAIVAVAECPDGSQVMGGGADDLTDGITYVNSPDSTGGTDAWVAVTDADPATNDATDLTAYARCWNPTASVSDSSQRTTARMISPSMRQMAHKVVARR